MRQSTQDRGKVSFVFYIKALDPEPELSKGSELVKVRFIFTGSYKLCDMRMYVNGDADVVSDPEALDIMSYALLKYVYSRRRAPA